MLTQNLPDFWEKLYSEKKDSWSIGDTTPALIEFMKEDACPKEGRVLVPGAGRGSDAIEWANRGYETLAVDFCPTAVDALDSLSRIHENFKALDSDIFDLNPDDLGQFDMIFEYNTFSAIHPGRRDEYFEVWYKMLRDDGIVIALFYPFTQGNTMQGPPHPTSEVELMARLDGIFDIADRIKVKSSIPEREGLEEFWILKKVL
ncbi:MAG: TPMT family class I SAM-dependent methyltransferase [Fibrobacterales bacterium]